MGTEGMPDSLQFIGIIFLFFLVLYIAYFVTKHLGKWQMNQSSGANMTIIEVLSVGPQKTLQLVRIGKKYLVIGVTREHITQIEEVSEADLIIQNQKNPMMPFDQLIKKLKR